MKVTMKIVLAAVAFAVMNTAYALDQTETGFFYPIGTESFSSECGTWLGRDSANEGCYEDGKYHLGVDMMYPINSDVYAIADGKVVYISYDDGSGDIWGVGNCALAVEHSKSNQSGVFVAIYGHLQCSTLKSSIVAGRPIGKIGHWKWGDHLHFSIHDGPYSTMAKSGWGRMSNSNWPSQNTFTNPLSFILANYAYDPLTQKQVSCQGNICWSPKDASSCETATNWYKGSEYPVVRQGIPWLIEVDNRVCGDLYLVFQAVDTSENPSESIPDDGWWRTFVRHIRSFLGETASAHELAQAMSANYTINTINVYTGNVVAGSSSKAGNAVGQGYLVQAITVPAQVPPDFIVRKTWLVTPWGDEVYQFGLQESFDTKAQSENIGDGPCNPEDPVQTITGHFYLSRGYKEDVHSGDGAWRRIDSTITQCDNLQPEETHTETKNTVIGQWITEPGMYNIVYCIDHPQDDHNNGGEHLEKHESNNCSTEAVFEVTANAIENQDPRFVDFVTSGMQFQQAPYYAGDQARFGATITNQGNVSSPSDIRSSYSIQCPGTSRIYLADDGTMASTLSAGASAFEENVGPVTLPNVAGTCTAYFCADYQNAVAESDEGNNCTSFSFVLQPRPAPRLVITKFQDEIGCCTTNTGSRIKPDIWVRNDGPIAPASDVTVTYHISSPVATGGAWWHIGYGIIHPSELPPGGTDEDYMDGNGYPIPQNSAWKLQWHTIRGCLKADGSAPVGDPATEVCAYYTRYSKK